MEELGGGEEFGKGGVGIGEDFESLKGRIGEMEEKNGRLEVEIRRMKDEVKLIYGEIKMLGLDKVRLGEEVCGLRRRNEELSERLECGKIVAEDEIKGLKERIIELEARVVQLEDNGVVKNGGVVWDLNGVRMFENGADVRASCGDLNAEGERVVSPAKDGLTRALKLNTPDKNPVILNSNSASTARRQLDCGRDRIPNATTMCSNLLAGVKSSGESIIYVGDSEEDEHIIPNNLPIPAAGNTAPSNSRLDDDDDDDEDGEVFVSGKLKRSFEVSGGHKHLDGLSATPKRKRVSNVVASDSESDAIPISMLLKKNIGNDEVNSGSEDELDTVLTDATQPSIPPRRRLISLSQHYGANGLGSGRETSPSNNKCIVYRTTEDVLDDGLENIEPESESEGESLGGFIVKGSDSNSQTDDGSLDGNDASVESRSDSDVEYGEIMSKLRRDKDHKMMWKLEGEMLSEFGKDSELCLKAVCALYRQQTSDEKQCKGTIHANGRGFNQLDALRGCELAEFLTNGDPNGDIKKSVEDLEKYYPNGVEVCRDLASRYSKQLFTIYQNKEDPLFLPTP